MQRSDSRRAHRLGDLIMREVSIIITTEMADPRLELVTVSGVRMNSDLSIAEVRYSVPGGDNIEDVQAALSKAAGYMRSQVAKRLKTKRMPKIVFKHDDYLEDMIYGKRPDAG